MPCSNKDALSDAIGVVLPGKHAGVKRPLLKLEFVEELSILETFISCWLLMAELDDDDCIDGFKILKFIGEDEATVAFFFIMLSIWPYWNEDSTWKKLTFNISLFLIIFSLI